MAKNTMIKKGTCLNVGNCNKANAKELIEVTIGEEFVCPECSGTLIEKKAKGVNMPLVIGGSVLLVAALAVGAYLLMPQQEPVIPPPTEEPVVVDSISTSQPVDTPTVDKPVIEEPVIEKPVLKEEQVAKEPAGPTTKDLGYAVWTGRLKNGKPHDTQGTLKFKTTHVIDSRDEKERTARAGESVIGTFENGHLVSGKWYKSDGNVESIILGSSN